MIASLLDWFGSLGLTGVFVLMTLESSIVPIPSELVMIPAGILAKQGLYPLWAIILLGGLGWVVWAWINRLLAQYLGKPFLLKYGKYILITNEKYHLAERLFLRNANLYTFIGRLLPVVRHLISLPAGVFNMPKWPFTLITFAGATLWSAVLALLGYYFGIPVLDTLEKYLWELKILVIIGLIGFIVWFFTLKTRKTKKNS